MSTERLDPLSKILLATQSINFMAATIHDLMKDHHYFGTEISKSSAKDHHAFLCDITSRLTPIMEEMGDFLNNRDAVCQIDVRITKAAFDILVSGIDDVNK